MKQKQPRLSRLARRALRFSTEKSGLFLPETLPKTSQGVPRPAEGVFWSLSHKEAFVAGLAATSPIGLDVEKTAVRNPSDRMFAKIVPPPEEELFEQNRPEIFFRCWTAKEAALKAEGLGLSGLPRCRVTAVANATRLTIAIDHRLWQISQFYFDHHLAAVAAENTVPCRWTLLNELEQVILTA
ncbi:MAG: 4'-phosphopantetheinyl transferase superfamily protein [Desulfosudaceae bacterium]